MSKKLADRLRTYLRSHESGDESYTDSKVAKTRTMLSRIRAPGWLVVEKEQNELVLMPVFPGQHEMTTGPIYADVQLQNNLLRVLGPLGEVLVEISDGESMYEEGWFAWFTFFAKREDAIQFLIMRAVA